MRPTQNNVFVSGASGSGKSYFFVDWIVKDLVPWSDTLIVTNLPLGRVPESHFVPPKFDGETFVDRIEARTGFDCKERFVVLDDEILSSWESGESGPWDLESIDGSKEIHLIIDEFANYCYTGMKQEVLEKWQRWLAKARHANCHNLMISQSSQKIPRRVFLEFGEKWQLSDTAGRVIPRLECTEGDLNQLISKAIRTEYARTQCMVRLNEGGTFTGKDDMPIVRVTRRRAIFALYDSFNAPEIGGESSNRSKEWEVLTWPQLIAWFIGRNIQATAMITAYFVFFSLCVMFSFYMWWPSADAGTLAEGQSINDEEKIDEEEKTPIQVGTIGGRPVFNFNDTWWVRPTGEGEDFRPENSLGSEVAPVRKNRILPDTEN